MAINDPKKLKCFFILISLEVRLRNEANAKMKPKLLKIIENLQYVEKSAFFHLFFDRLMQIRKRF